MFLFIILPISSLVFVYLTSLLGDETFDISTAYIVDDVTLEPGEMIEIYAEITVDGMDDRNDPNDDDD